MYFIGGSLYLLIPLHKIFFLSPFTPFMLLAAWGALVYELIRDAQYHGGISWVLSVCPASSWMNWSEASGVSSRNKSAKGSGSYDPEGALRDQFLKVWSCQFKGSGACHWCLAPGCDWDTGTLNYFMCFYLCAHVFFFLGSRRACVHSRSVMSDSVTVWTVACHPWDYPGKNIGVGCHLLFQGNLPDQGAWTLVFCISSISR